MLSIGEEDSHSAVLSLSILTAADDRRIREREEGRKGKKKRVSIVDANYIKKRNIQRLADDAVRIKTWVSSSCRNAEKDALRGDRCEERERRS